MCSRTASSWFSFWLMSPCLHYWSKVRKYDACHLVFVHRSLLWCTLYYWIWLICGRFWATVHRQRCLFSPICVNRCQIGVCRWIFVGWCPHLRKCRYCCRRLRLNGDIEVTVVSHWSCEFHTSNWRGNCIERYRPWCHGRSSLQRWTWNSKRPQPSDRSDWEVGYRHFRFLSTCTSYSWCSTCTCLQTAFCHHSLRTQTCGHPKVLQCGQFSDLASHPFAGHLRQTIRAFRDHNKTNLCRNCRSSSGNHQRNRVYCRSSHL